MSEFLEALSDWHNMVNGGMKQEIFLDKHEIVLGKALRIAHALTQEPSEKMKELAYEHYARKGHDEEWMTRILARNGISVFKAMAEQLIKEVGDDL